MWTKEKPEIIEPCMLICMRQYSGEYDYEFYEIIQLPGWGLLSVFQDDDYWGEIEEIEADMYFVVPLIDLKT